MNNLMHYLPLTITTMQSEDTKIDAPTESEVLEF